MQSNKLKVNTWFNCANLFLLHLEAMVIIERSSDVLAKRFDMHFVVSFQQHLYLTQRLYVVSGSAVYLFIQIGWKTNNKAFYYIS